MKARKDFTDAQKATMMLSRETLEGLHISGKEIMILSIFNNKPIFYFVCTVKSFCELARFLLNMAEGETPYLLSEHFSQDPIENYFGQQRSREGWCQNPTVQTCISSAQSLRVQGSLAMMPVRGNSRRKKRLFPQEVIDEKPLPKRPRKK